jgi:hypothetical protein
LGVDYVLAIDVAHWIHQHWLSQGFLEDFNHVLDIRTGIIVQIDPQ